LENCKVRKLTFLLSLVLIFLIPWEGAVKVANLGTATRLSGLFLVVLWGATVLITGQLRKPGLFQFLMMLMVLWYISSVFWSAEPNRTVNHLKTWVQLFIFAYIIWDLYTTKEAVLSGLQAYVLGAYVAVGMAWANYLAGDAFYDRYSRFSPGDTTNPDGFGTMLAMGIPMAWYLAGSKISAQKSSLMKFFNYAYIPVAFIGISLSGTRTALIAAIPAMAFGIASLTRVRLWGRIGIFLILSTAVWILLPQMQSLRSFQRFDTIVPEITEGDLNERTLNWREGIESFKSHPLLGVGNNMYRTVNRWGKVAHNSFISVLVEVGLIGLALFVGALGVAVLRAWGQPRWDKWFWLTLFLVWTICSTTLAWEDKKLTWLFLSLIVASGSPAPVLAEAQEPEAPAGAAAGQIAWQAE
jgi:O-antigen ligase